MKTASAPGEGHEKTIGSQFHSRAADLTACSADVRFKKRQWPQDAHKALARAFTPKHENGHQEALCGPVTSSSCVGCHRVVNSPFAGM